MNSLKHKKYIVGLLILSFVLFFIVAFFSNADVSKILILFLIHERGVHIIYCFLFDKTMYVGVAPFPTNQIKIRKFAFVVGLLALPFVLAALLGYGVLAMGIEPII